MKNFIYVLVAALSVSLAACTSNKKKNVESTEQQEVALSVDKAVCLEDLLANAEANVGKEVTLRGVITHTCKHSGRRCFIAGKDQKTTIRVEAKGNIGGFNRELIGSEVVVKGTLRENRLTKEYLAQMEEDLNDKQGKENAETCESELKNIEGMREWMKANNKDFYSVYYMDGLEYEVVE